MANATAKDVMRQAILQIGYTEYPPGSNNNKFGKWYGLNKQPWCAEFVCWCGAHAPGNNPIALSANAADIQDLTVSKKYGKWVMKKTGSTNAKKKGVAKVRFGDNVSLDFGANNRKRQHTALAIGHIGNYYVCVEGNTSFGERGSQDNGGAVAMRDRYYTQVCCIDRPDYGKPKPIKITRPYTGDVPKLPSRGYFQKGDKGMAILAMQHALNWSCDAEIKSTYGIFGNETLFGVIWFQVTYGLDPDGKFGVECLRKLKAIIEKHKKMNEKKPTTKKPTKKKTKAEKLNERAIADAYAYRTDSSKYKYPTGKPKKQYKEDLDEAFPHRSGWNPQTRAGAACDVYVPVVARATGIDKHMPHGLEDMIPYFEKHCGKNDPWKLVPSKEDKKGHYYSPGMLQGGDIVVQDYKGKGAGAHTFYIVEKNGKKYISEAQFHGKTYPHISKVLKTMRKSSFDMLRVYRARG